MGALTTLPGFRESPRAPAASAWRWLIVGHIDGADEHLGPVVSAGIGGDDADEITASVVRSRTSALTFGASASVRGTPMLTAGNSNNRIGTGAWRFVIVLHTCHLLFWRRE